MAELPEDIIVNIFSRLPVKSLIRFTSLSKRLRFIILFDPKFAQAQFKAAPQHKTRFLLFTGHASLFESIDDSSSFGQTSSVRKLSLPLPACYFKLLGSCNGLVFVGTIRLSVSIWNPSTGFFKQLSDPGFSSSNFRTYYYYGVGYLPATDDYKVLLCTYDLAEEPYNLDDKVHMFSSKCHSWKRIESTGHHRFGAHLNCEGILLNNALHWLNRCGQGGRGDIVTFDLEEEEFRRMPLPSFEQDGMNFGNVGVRGGCMCVLHYYEKSVNFWVMKEYDVSESWTKLYSIELLNLNFNDTRFLVVEGTAIAINYTGKGVDIIRIDLKEDKKVGYHLDNKLSLYAMIEYEESLLSISD